MDWTRIGENALGGVLAGLVLFVLVSLTNYLGRRRWFWYVAAAAALVAGYIFVWVRYEVFRAYILPMLTFCLGALGAVLWSRWPAVSLLFGRTARLSILFRQGKIWTDSLRGEAVNKRRWQLMDSVPPGMLQPTSTGIVTAWPGGPPGYDRSGFLVAQLELDEGDFCVEFETRVDRYGSGWDAGVHLLETAEPRSKVCAALRYLPAPWSNAEHDALCLLVNGQKEHPFLVSPQEWVRAKVEISGQRCRATVNNHVHEWRPMGSRPQRLVVGATPVDWHAEGREARYLFRDLTVRSWHPT